MLLFFLDQRQKSKGASSSCCSAACSILWMCSTTMQILCI